MCPKLRLEGTQSVTACKLGATDRASVFDVFSGEKASQRDTRARLWSSGLVAFLQRRINRPNGCVHSDDVTDDVTDDLILAVAHTCILSLSRPYTQIHRCRVKQPTRGGIFSKEWAELTIRWREPLHLIRLCLILTRWTLKAAR